MVRKRNDWERGRDLARTALIDALRLVDEGKLDEGMVGTSIALVHLTPVTNQDRVCSMIEELLVARGVKVPKEEAVAATPKDEKAMKSLIRFAFSDDEGNPDLALLPEFRKALAKAWDEGACHVVEKYGNDYAIKATVRDENPYNKAPDTRIAKGGGE